MENIKMNNMKEKQTNEKVIVVYQINEDNYEHYIGKTVKVAGNVNLSNLGLRKIPINFTTVGGGFYFHNNKLTSLEGCPKEIDGTFDYSYNKLASVEG